MSAFDVLDRLLREKEEEEEEVDVLPDGLAETVLAFVVVVDDEADKFASCLLLAATVAALDNRAFEAIEELIREEDNLPEEEAEEEAEEAAVAEEQAACDEEVDDAELEAVELVADCCPCDTNRYKTRAGTTLFLILMDGGSL